MAPVCRASGGFRIPTLLMTGVCPCLDSLVFGQPDLLDSPQWTDGLETLYNEVLARLAPGKRPFLVPGLRKDKTSAWSQGHAVREGMSYRAWTELFRGILVQLGEGAGADRYTFNSVRRFMPTLAGFLQLDEQQAQALGYWQEIPKGQDTQGSGPLSVMRVKFPMSARYSGVKVQVSGRVQLASIAILMEMLRRARRAMDEPSPKKWRQSMITWQDLERHRLSQEEVVALLESLGSAVEPGGPVRLFQSADVVSNILQPGEDAPLTTRRRAHSGGLHHHASSSSKALPRQVSTESSSSSVEASEQLDEVIPNYRDLKTLGWFVLHRSCTSFRKRSAGISSPGAGQTVSLRELLSRALILWR